MKSITRIFTVWIFVQMSFPVFTQIDFKHFPIDSFKLPSIHWTGLELGGTIVGTYDYAHELEGEGKNNSSYFSPQASLQYSGFINRPDIQSSYNLRTNPVFSVRHNNNDITNYLNTDRYYSPDAHLFWTQLKYHDRSFFQLGLDADVDYYNRHTRTELDTLNTMIKQSNFSSSLAIPIGFGKGRIEPVSDIVMALFLLQDAVGIGLDPQSIHAEDVVAFGERKKLDLYSNCTRIVYQVG